ncbi:helix-turn-helix domain-containing protein [uncultured Senegalimassilia sp.]|uniref:helix-turn-helix domain-containing protein n=1 Tax=uncultured Senegalimassilia sp. TaxID=1714350 RepID=UPI003421A2E1
MLFVSRPHLCSAFSRETEQGIGHYARARRVERAKTMLVGCCSVAQVVTRLGWTHCSTFSQAFKQSPGVSPIEWRNSNSQ